MPRDRILVYGHASRLSVVCAREWAQQARLLGYEADIAMSDVPNPSFPNDSDWFHISAWDRNSYVKLNEFIRDRNIKGIVNLSDFTVETVAKACYGTSVPHMNLHAASTLAWKKKFHDESLKLRLNVIPTTTLESFLAEGMNNRFSNKFVVKPNMGVGSSHVYTFDSISQLKEIIESGEAWKGSSPIGESLIQPFVPGTVKRLSVSFLNRIPYLNGILVNPPGDSINKTSSWIIRGADKNSLSQSVIDRFMEDLGELGELLDIRVGEIGIEFIEQDGEVWVHDMNPHVNHRAWYMRLELMGTEYMSQTIQSLLGESVRFDRWNGKHSIVNLVPEEHLIEVVRQGGIPLGRNKDFRAVSSDSDKFKYFVVGLHEDSDVAKMITEYTVPES